MFSSDKYRYLNDDLIFPVFPDVRSIFLSYVAVLDFNFLGFLSSCKGHHNIWLNFHHGNFTSIQVRWLKCDEVTEGSYSWLSFLW